jgi:5-carboxymethyl-2-hydroxymuconate isomerase
MRATTALLELFKDEREWRRFFRSCCEMSTRRLMAQAWQFGDELRERGYLHPADEIKVALLGLARDLLPESVAAGWDAEWAHEWCKDALAHLAEHYAGLFAEEKDALDLSTQAVWDERVVAAGLDNNPAVFRRALKGWERSGMEAIERVRVSEGGAA